MRRSSASSSIRPRSASPTLPTCPAEPGHPRRFVGWQTFFDFGDGEVKPNKLIDTTLSTPLFNLPPATIVKFTATDIGPTSLPQRTLLRHLTWEQPSGQRLARRMNLPTGGPPFRGGTDRGTSRWSTS